MLQYADQWELGDEFKTWIKEENIFCSTLVDRIVTGYPRNEAASICQELGYEDNLIDTGEVFGFWVIEGPQSLKKELPFEEAGLPVIICDDHKPYKQRKVRILNGAHTSMVLGAYLAGQDIVRDCMNDKVICGFMNKTIYDEIIPTLTLPESELKEFAAACNRAFQQSFCGSRSAVHLLKFHLQVGSQSDAVPEGLCGEIRQAAGVHHRLLRFLYRFLSWNQDGRQRPGWQPRRQRVYHQR